MIIDTEAKLKAHLRIFKMRLLKEGCDKLQLYPIFCLHYQRNKEKYKMPNGKILDMACEILIEED